MSLHSTKVTREGGHGSSIFFLLLGHSNGFVFYTLEILLITVVT